MSFPDIMEGATAACANAPFDRSRSVVDEKTSEILSAYKLAALKMKSILGYE